MNWAAFAAVVSCLGLLATLVIVPYTYGKLTQEVVETRSKTADHALTLKEHATKLEEHGENIGRLQEWKNGFNAAARVSGNKEVQ